jgi:sigma-B regulation protein RsbU (phosphoserine phosphatase)
VEQAEIIMKKELEQAAEIQRNLLPRHAPPVEGLELAAFSYPCRSVGGDYFDYLKMAGGRLGLIVGDVAGKGLAAALLMSSLPGARAGAD